MSERQELTARVLAAKRARGLSWTALADRLEAPLEWTVSALLGQFPLSERQARAAVEALELPETAVPTLMAVPARGSLDAAVPADPTVYRLYEVVQVHGMALKELIHEEFGDGIMSAINFGFRVRRVPGPDGDRVEIVLNGKFLPYDWREPR